MRRIYDKAGNLVSEHPGTQPPKDGVLCARAECGTPLNRMAEAAAPAAAPAAAGEAAAVQSQPEIVALMRELDPNDPSVWTASGKPRVESVEDRLGRQITRADRDAAWAVVFNERKED